jgi:hypothetical protein
MPLLDIEDNIPSAIFLAQWAISSKTHELEFPGVLVMDRDNS